MALFDKLKNVADKAKETAEKAAALAKEKIEQQQQAAKESAAAAAEAEKERKAAAAKAEEERKIAEAEAKKQKWEDLIEQQLSTPSSSCYDYCKGLSYEDQDKFTAQLRHTYIKKLSECTNCDLGKGDCVWQGDKFFCTCGDNVDCPRKQYIKKSQTGILRSPEHIVYVKALSSFEKQQSIIDECKFNYYSKASVLIDFKELLLEFFETFCPGQAGNFLVTKQAPDFLFNYGIGDDNPVMHIAYEINEKSGGEESVYLGSLIKLFEDGIDLQQDFFSNLSLYDRDSGSFEYTVKVLDVLNDPIKTSNCFSDLDKVDINKLYNPDGTIKDAGIGGPKNGYYGDVIYNIIASWSEEE